MTLDWDGFAAGTSIFTTIFLTEAWDTDHALAEAHPDGVGEDIRQTLSMADAVPARARRRPRPARRHGGSRCWTCSGRWSCSPCRRCRCSRPGWRT